MVFALRLDLNAIHLAFKDDLLQFRHLPVERASKALLLLTKPRAGEERIVHKQLLPHRSGDRKGVCPFMSDNRADLAGVAVPTLILQCSEDIIASQQVGEFVHRKIPNSRMIVLQATGHCPNLSAPEEVVSAMRTFV